MWELGTQLRSSDKAKVKLLSKTKWIHGMHFMQQTLAHKWEVSKPVFPVVDCQPSLQRSCGIFKTHIAPFPKYSL